MAGKHRDTPWVSHEIPLSAQLVFQTKKATNGPSEEPYGLPMVFEVPGAVGRSSTWADGLPRVRVRDPQPEIAGEFAKVAAKSRKRRT